MKIIDLIYRAKLDGVDIVFNDGRLQLKLPENTVIDQDLLGEIRANRQLLIDFLKGGEWNRPPIRNTEETIRKFDRDANLDIPLSYSQERLWFIDRLKGSLEYHIPAVLRLKGELNINALELALKSIVARHEVLRTIIKEKEGVPFQQILTGDDWRLSKIDDKEYGDPLQLVEKIKALIAAPFHLGRDYFFRATLIRTMQQEHYLVVVSHHIVSDGWSTGIVVKEMAELYNAFIENREPNLPTLELQYADYALWQRNMQVNKLANSLVYWKNKLAGVEVLELSTDFRRPAIQKNDGGVVEFKISKTVAKDLRDLSRQNDATLFMSLLATFKILLHRYSTQHDITVGTPVVGRQQQQLQSLIGFFVNTLALRTGVYPRDTFVELLGKVKQTTLEAYQHQDFPFDKLIEVVVNQRNTNRHPLFEVMFVLQNIQDTGVPELGRLDVSIEKIYQRSTSLFDLTLAAVETSDGLDCKVEYCKDLFSEATIYRMVGYFSRLLESVISQPAKPIGFLGMLSEHESKQILGTFNHSLNYAGEQTIVHLFEEQVQKSPGQIAVALHHNSLTYKQLDEASNKFSNYLQSKGVAAGCMVPLCIERSIEMVVAMLGILKAGAAYVPVDRSTPGQRLQHIINDVGATFIVTDWNYLDDILITDAVELINFYQCREQVDLQSATPPYKPAASDLCYVIYTSGSTGLPKGVMVEHRSVAASTLARKELYKETGSILLIPSISFDASIATIFGVLAMGGRLILCTEDALKDAVFIRPLLEKSDSLLCVPSYYQFLLQEGLVQHSGISKVILGGEKLESALVSAHFDETKNIRLYNEYGPTETTVWATVAEIEADTDLVTIGKPISSVRAYIMDASLQLVPIGVTGELCIGGVQLARGYLNEPGLTARQFIVDPFSDGQERIYRTGDLCRWLPDGRIEYLGRMDEQVKIRGYRIEPGEIEKVLQSTGKIKQAAVVAKLNAIDNLQLVAYVVAEEFNQLELVDLLKKGLPEYMIPSIWVRLEQMPLTPNGKTDRKQLPEPVTNGQLPEQYIEPVTAVEKQLVHIWQELLGIEQVGITDNFFELGGHSLLAVRLVSAIRKRMGIEIGVADIFQYPNVKSLAENLKRRDDIYQMLPVIKSIQPRPAQIPLSFSQERLWFIHRLAGSLQYHIPGVFRLRGKLNKQALILSLQATVNRHEALRTVFIEQEGEVFQQLLAPGTWDLLLTEAVFEITEQQLVDDFVQNEISRPFDLSRDHMFRASLLEFHSGDYLLVMTLHHIASDGWSQSIVVKELAALYRAYAAEENIQQPQIPIQYADYSIWQREHISGDLLHSKLGYWKTKLNDIDAFELHPDFPRPIVQNVEGNIVNFQFDAQLSAAMKELGLNHGATVFMTLLAAFKLLLHRYTDHNDICVGTVVAGRQQQELEQLVGFFVNTLALRTEVRNNMSFIDLLREVKKTTTEAFENQEIPFEKIVEAVVKSRDTSRHPLFQVMFILQNTPEISQLDLHDIEFVQQPLDRKTSSFDISFTMSETEDGLTGTVVFSTALYKEQTIHQLVAHFRTLLIAIVQNPMQQVGNLEMLSKEEHKKLSIDFNSEAQLLPPSGTIVDRIEEQSALWASVPAVVFEDFEVSYSELNNRSNQLAYYLLSAGVSSGSIVPICIQRSTEMIIAVLGVLKAGGAYVPIDPQYPAQRIDTIFNELKPSVVLSSALIMQKISFPANGKIIDVDDRTLLDSFPSDNLKTILDRRSLAYLIYTSGSTGTPKAVMIEHEGLLNLCQAQSSILGLKPGMRTLQFASLGFDASVSEIFTTLSTGGSLVLCKEEDIFSAARFAALVKRHRIDILTLPPSYQAIVRDSLEGVRTIISAGEPLNTETARFFQSKGVKVFNAYGPTENTVCVSMTDNPIGTTNEITIGKPIPNVHVYVLGSSGTLMPPGCIGEICVGGVQVAGGYYMSHSATEQKFSNDPFIGKPGARLYRTGDLGRWREDGSLEYFGRIDQQVKIRGHRIELEEIENALHGLEFITQAAVIAKDSSDGVKSLVAFVVITGESFDRNAILSALHERLPVYMMPSRIIKVASIPVTAHGKIDRKALSESTLLSGMGTNYIPPVTDVEKKLASIWKDLLCIEQVGISDNFFELGGHSLLVIKLISNIKKEFLLEIPVSALFEFTTIAELAKYIEFEIAEDEDRKRQGMGNGQDEENITDYEIMNL